MNRSLYLNVKKSKLGLLTEAWPARQLEMIQKKLKRHSKMRLGSELTTKFHISYRFACVETSILLFTHVLMFPRQIVEEFRFRNLIQVGWEMLPVNGTSCPMDRA